MMVARIGRWVIQRTKGFLYACGFFFQVVRASFRFARHRQLGYRVLTLQVLFTGVEAVGVVSVLALALGAVIIIQGLSLLPQFGQGRLVYIILITVITRELGPILTAFIIIARSGTAIATELGNMVISHEIEAYLSIGVDPISYLVVPRFLGVTLSLLILNIYFNLFGLAGSFFVSALIRPVQFVDYFRELLVNLQPADILSSLIKSLAFGVIISTVATYNGFRVSQSSTEIPQMVIKAVGQGFVLCVVADAVITLIYYLR
ncbi:MAG TPA: ABC transporter permease [Spirochaetia bacterium]|nr:ABC transporter permease [Spirochaetia bacterium]